MMGDEKHIRRLRCYEFGYVVPWGEIVSEMESETPAPSSTETDRTGDGGEQR